MDEMQQMNGAAPRGSTHRERAAMAARLAFIVGVGLITALSLAPASALPPLGLWDKLEHAVAYALLAATGCTGFVSRRGRIAVLIGLAIYGGAIEVVQPVASASRESSVADWVANLTGIGVGYVLALLIRLFMRRTSLA
ncbi:MAG: hypothetical protein JNM75_04620 [Rhodospirillales bacterium]|nr:hypothetical protein [Rhodospirillales bacterium]